MWYNGIMLALLRSPLHWTLSDSVLALTYTGHKSGREYSLPVNYVRDSEDPKRLLITSTPARTWWRNLGKGRTVSLRLRGRKILATGRIIDGQDAVAALAAYFRGAPHMARYFEVKITDGEPDASDVARVAPSRVMVEIILPNDN